MTGTVNVTGSTSKWTGTSDAVYVGYYGPGYLNITSGGTVSTGGITYIGNESAASGYGSGTVTVDGSGSSWTTGQLDVGYAGTGSLTISNGASVTTTFSNTQEYIGALLAAAETARSRLPAPRRSGPSRSAAA